MLVLAFSLGAVAMDVLIADVVSDAHPVLRKSQTIGRNVNFTIQEIATKLGIAEKEFKGIIVTKLPPIEQGVLALDGREVKTFEKIPQGKIPKLTFMPMSDYSGDISFFIKPYDKTGYMDINAEIVMSYKDTLSLAPIANDSSLSTYNGMRATGFFDARDFENGALNYVIFDEPSYGEVTVDSQNGSYKYTHLGFDKAADSFSYYCENSQGEMSTLATVTINIEDGANAVFYSDMEGHWANYASSKLYDVGLIRGEKIGQNYFFSPSSSVTKGDYLSMVMDLCNIEIAGEVSASSVLVSNDTPVWMHSCVAAGNFLGIIKPSDTESPYFSVLHDVSRAEAAVMLARTLDLDSSDDPSVTTSFCDDDEIPSWAKPAVNSLEKAGIIHGRNSKTFAPNDKLTRAECAAMLYNAKRRLDMQNIAPPTLWQRVINFFR